ncbi:MAG: hypothetical protein NZL91_00180 [Thermoflexales bacterium]|nr:hypothetical protein [Thermoflexales bacterium]
MSGSSKRRRVRRWSLERALAAMQMLQPLPPGALLALSDLSGERFEAWRAAWEALPAERRVALAEQLRDASERHFVLDFNAIFAHTLSDQEVRVRLAAAEGLALEPSAAHIDVLTRTLAQDPSEAVRAAAASALGVCMEAIESGQLAPRWREQVYRALMDALRREAYGSLAYRRALEAVACVSTEAVDWYIRDAYASEDDLLHLSAVTAMGLSHNPAYRPLVRAELHSISPAVRRAAARACGNLDDEEAVQDLVLLLEDPDEEVRQAALAGLADISARSAREALERATRSADEDLAARAREALEMWLFWHADLDEVSDALFRLMEFDEDALRSTRVITPRIRRSLGGLSRDSHDAPSA